MKMKKRQYTCKLCGIIIRGYGSNGIGHALTKGGVCCDQCNLEKVLPARMRGIHL